MDSVEASNQASSDAILHDYEDKNISLIRLVKSLLATATMPHIVLIVVTSIYYTYSLELTHLQFFHRWHSLALR